jgi:hypothetical protein
MASKTMHCDVVRETARPLPGTVSLQARGKLVALVQFPELFPPRLAGITAGMGDEDRF